MGSTSGMIREVGASGARQVLLAHGIEVPLVVTHADSPGETIWFESVAATAAEYRNNFV